MLKYFLDVSEDEQERRFRARVEDPLRQWKLSPMDVESYNRWWDYTRAYDEMIRATDTRHAPWWIVPSNDKKRARINCISHILSSIPYERVAFEKPNSVNAKSGPTTLWKIRLHATWCLTCSDRTQFRTNTGSYLISVFQLMKKPTSPGIPPGKLIIMALSL